MRVLMVNYEFPPVGGGAGRVTQQLCRQLPAHGIALDVLTSTGNEPAEFNEGEARVHALPVKRRSVHETGVWAIAQFLVRAAAEQKRLLRQAARAYDLVHYMFSIPTGILSLQLHNKIPFMVTLHGGDIPGYCPGEMQIMHHALKPVNRRILRAAACVTAVSSDLASAAQQIQPAIHPLTVHNGVDTALFLPGRSTDTKRDGSFELLSVTRLLKWKGLQYLLQALHKLDNENVRLTIVGTGAYEHHLRKMTLDLELEQKVRFLGPVRHESLPDIYRSADLFVLPSFGDSFSLTVAEAMACGLPIIATHEGGPKEFVTHEKNGYLVPSRSTSALADAIYRLWKSPEIRARMAIENAAAAKTTLSWGAIARRYAAIYATCIGDVKDVLNESQQPHESR